MAHMALCKLINLNYTLEFAEKFVKLVRQCVPKILVRMLAWQVFAFWPTQHRTQHVLQVIEQLGVFGVQRGVAACFGELLIYDRQEDVHQHEYDAHIEQDKQEHAHQVKRAFFDKKSGPAAEYHLKAGRHGGGHRREIRELTIVQYEEHLHKAEPDRQEASAERAQLFETQCERMQKHDNPLVESEQLDKS